ncbi:MAG: hypothetical protein JWQ81_857 [Amycolatopsis sp.]|uniref:hypothetical protein n=1 Tax=Amycolatopsis sp. TaxID=37632 RepID=UPI00260A6EAB|nr:hypothetical protein [Amycolatopsis sp.]MCU1680118.1 hypothetical protein [Amycolatopsis sp.]
MQFPHRVVIVTPQLVTDSYDNPTPQLVYGDDTPRRTVWGLVQPGSSAEPAQPGRQPVLTSWRLFTASPVAARERVEWRGQVLDVAGEPSWWSPRFGTHYEARLTHVQG